MRQIMITHEKNSFHFTIYAKRDTMRLRHNGAWQEITRYDNGTQTIQVSLHDGDIIDIFVFRPGAKTAYAILQAQYQTKSDDEFYLFNVTQRKNASLYCPYDVAFFE